MNPETLSRLSSFWSLLFFSSALNPIHQPSSSSSSPSNKNPESTLRQSFPDVNMSPPRCPESKSIEANKDKLASLTTSSHPHQANFSSASSSSLEINCGEENTLSSSPPPLFRHSQVNGISTTRVSYSCPNYLNTNPQISHSSPEEKGDELLPEATNARRNCLLRVDTDASIPSYPSPSSSAIFSRQEGAVSSLSSKNSFPQSETTHNPQPEAETTRRRGSSKFLHVIEIMDEQDLARHLLVLAIPTGVGLVISASSLDKTKEIHIVAITLLFAITFMWNSLLLRKTYINSSIFLRVSGAALMMLSFCSLVACFLPLYLKWVPVVCWLASLFPFAMYGWACLQRDEMKDPEKGELVTGKTT